MIKKIFFVICCLFLSANLFGCGHVVQTPSSSSLDDTPIAAEPTYTNSGKTGGIFTSSDNNFSAVVPSGSMPAALGANPTVTQTAIDPGNIIENTSETIISKSYDMNLSSGDNFITSESVQITMAFDSTKVPPSKLDPLYIFAKIYNADDQLLVSVAGSIAGSNLVLDLRGLPRDAIYTVVYDPDIQTINSDVISASSIGTLATPVPPWQTNLWQFRCNPNNNYLRTAVGSFLVKAPAALTTAEITSVIRNNIANNAVRAGAVYQTAGFRQPNLRPRNISGSLVYIIWPTKGGSSFTGGDLKANQTYAFGDLYVDPARLSGIAGEGLGSVLASVAHEMFHSIQSGYDMGYSIACQGYKEGTAATYGYTIDSGAALPLVRTAVPSEIHLLSTYLGCENIAGNSYAYANQDFFAYVGRAYNAGTLTYLKNYFELLKTDIDALVKAGSPEQRYGTSRKVLWDSLSKTLNSLFGKDLPAVYFDYVKNRAMAHSAKSVLRSGEPSAMTLNESLFARDALVKKNADPSALGRSPVTGSFATISSFSSRALVITSTKVVDNVNAKLTLTLTAGTLGSNVKAILYRNGVGTEIVGPIAIPKFGSSASDTLTILISNVDSTQNIGVSYIFGLSEKIANTFAGTAIISGSTYTITPSYLAGALGTYGSQGEARYRSGLPGIYASEGTNITDISKTLSLIITSPSVVTTSEGTFSVGDGPTVFEKGNGAATIAFQSALLTNVDDGTPVGFSSTSGTITFTKYGSNYGDRLTGTFTANITGNRTTSLKGAAQHTQVTMTGTYTANFDVELVQE